MNGFMDRQVLHFRDHDSKVLIRILGRWHEVDLEEYGMLDEEVREMLNTGEVFK